MDFTEFPKMEDIQLTQFPALSRENETEFLEPFNLALKAETARLSLRFAGEVTLQGLLSLLDFTLLKNGKGNESRVLVLHNLVEGEDEEESESDEGESEGESDAGESESESSEAGES